MRKAAVLPLLVAIMVTGCGQTPTPSTTQSAKPVQASQPHSPTPPAPKAPQGILKETAPPEPTETYRFPTIDPKKEERANDDIALICGIITREVNTHEFPQLWLKGSRESQLADEYERLLPGAQAHEALMRDCPAYAELHSKNAG